MFDALKAFYFKRKRIILISLVLYLILAGIIVVLLMLPGVEDQPFVYQVF